MHNKKDDTKQEVRLPSDQIFPLKNKNNNNIEMRNVESINRAQKTIPIVASKKLASGFLQHLECDYDMNEQQPIEYFEANKWSPISNSIVAATKSSYYQPSMISYDYYHAQPIIDPIWRGKMVINNMKSIVSMAAHLSTRACPKAIEAAKTLAPTIDVETKPRHDVWPARFQESPPTVESIALFFFPESESEEQFFDRLLEGIIKRDYSLKSMVSSVELLVFPSHKLPPEHSRFNGKYYLWGIFRNKQKKAVTESKY
ncbi:uncharacterized protein LOC124936616 [Impatiens glandulifera]|uniref:uncharacterized protein LOC124936616 n=1 Tax=Impatiens glandulifera TaxID=253017 RepID=UPI001FB0F9D0|nr:uncharacterized protein LOC124936616 [Impatiens glandulifera]XP_047333086.1 uncharacterized protein LOC124936616 [Impatiens glandulifera]